MLVSNDLVLVVPSASLVATKPVFTTGASLTTNVIGVSDIFVAAVPVKVTTLPAAAEAPAQPCFLPAVNTPPVASERARAVLMVAGVSVFTVKPLNALATWAAVAPLEPAVKVSPAKVNCWPAERAPAVNFHTSAAPASTPPCVATLILATEAVLRSGSFATRVAVRSLVKVT